MKKTGILNEWRGSLDKMAPSELRVGEDFILLKNYSITPRLYEPFTTDVTTAIIRKSGVVSCVLNMTRYVVEAPCMFLIQAGDVMQYVETPYEGEHNSGWVLIMSDNFFDGILKSDHVSNSLFRSFLENPVVKYSEADMKIMDSYMSLLENLLRSTDNPYRLQAVRSLMLTVFYGYFFKTHGDLEKEVAGVRGETVFNNFITLLKKNYRQRRDVGFYSDKLCLTPKYLSSLIKRVSGKTITDWIDDFVLTESKALLRSTDLSVSQICDGLNFDSQTVFGKFFKRKTGMSPREYRKKTV